MIEYIESMLIICKRTRITIRITKIDLRIPIKINDQDKYEDNDQENQNWLEYNEMVVDLNVFFEDNNT